MKVSENYQKMLLVAFLLKHLICPIHPTMTMPKTDTTKIVSFVCSQNYFKIAGRASVMVSTFSAVTETSAIYNSVEKSNTCMVYS